MWFVLGLFNHRIIGRMEFYSKWKLIIILRTASSRLFYVIWKWRLWWWLAILGFGIHCCNRYWIRISLSIYCSNWNLPIFATLTYCLLKHRILKRYKLQWRSYVGLNSNLTIISLCWSWSICFLIILRRSYYICFMRNSIRPCYLSCWLQWCWNTTILDCEKFMGYILGKCWLCLHWFDWFRKYLWYLWYSHECCCSNLRRVELDN